MSQRVEMTVNGAAVVAEGVPPRVHLADFLREERLLTGTHLGCEHGVCGACTLLIDGAPARSCIAYAAACDGADIRTIEGLENDPVIVRLRAAFTAEHALQCGYCTPGMLVTARDIVQRLPQADAARIRLELAGNLCRCTGYAGIVRAIARVLAEPHGAAALPPAAPLPVRLDAASAPAAAAAPASAVAPGEVALQQRLRIAAPVEAVWRAVQDPSLIAACVPGAQLTDATGGQLAGTLALGLGPMQARFAGTATVHYGPGQEGRVRGAGQDRLSRTRLSAEADFALHADGAQATLLDFSVRYALRGPLSQFARGPVVAAFAAEIAETVGANLAARLAGAESRPARMGLGRMLLRVLRRWLSGG